MFYCSALSIFIDFNYLDSRRTAKSPVSIEIILLLINFVWFLEIKVFSLLDWDHASNPEWCANFISFHFQVEIVHTTPEIDG